MKAMKKFYKECHLAARMYYDANEVWSDLKVGQLLQLRREADNSYDANAVQVIFTKPDENGEPEEFVLGYIPRDENTELAAFLNLGWGEIFECRIRAASTKIRITNSKSTLLFVSSAIQNLSNLADYGISICTAFGTTSMVNGESPSRSTPSVSASSVPS